METVSLDYLLNFGALGVVLAWLMWQYSKTQEREERLSTRLETVINNNTIALTKVYEEMQHEEVVETEICREITDLKELRKIQEEKKNAAAK